MYIDLQVSGASSSSGRQYLIIRQGDEEAIVPRDAATIGNKVFDAELARLGIPIVDRKHLNHLLENIRMVSAFPECPILERIGWNDDAFVLVDGIVVPNDGSEGHFRALPPTVDKCGTSGSLKGWRDLVAGPLAGQPVAEFVMMMPFVAPLLRFMPSAPGLCLELVGPSGCMKDDLIRLAASACGDPADSHSRYWEPLRAVVDDLDQMRVQHRDHPLLIGEPNALLGTADKKLRARVYRTIAHDLSAAVSRRGAGVGASPRMVAVLATDTSLRSLAGAFGESDNLITLQIPGWAQGVFDGLPADGLPAAVHADQLVRMATVHHGHAFRRFVRKAAQANAKSSEKLVAKLERYQQEFLRTVRIDRNQGDEYRVASAFAAAYAAGAYAREKLILPRTFDCLGAALTCYEAYRASAKPPLSLAERLEALILSGDLFAIHEGEDPARQNFLAAEAMGIVKFTSTHREVRILPKNIMRALPDWYRLQKDPEVLALLKTEGRNLRIKARLTPTSPRERMFCFMLPLAEQAHSEPSLFDQPEAE